MIHQGDCVEVMAAMDAESIDAIVTDPPYGLEFMGKEWDRLGITAASPVPKRGNLGGFATGDKPSFARVEKHLPEMQQWHTRWATEALRVAKPGAYLLAFGGTRTVHRLSCALEDAGWIIRDTLVWAYAQGFPKSRSSLKPAWEPIVLARKPGPLAKLRIDECRLPTSETAITKPRRKRIDSENDVMSSRYQRKMGYRPDWKRDSDEYIDLPGASGRWPANVILGDAVFEPGVESVVTVQSGSGKLTAWSPSPDSEQSPTVSHVSTAVPMWSPTELGEDSRASADGPVETLADDSETSTDTDRTVTGCCDGTTAPGSAISGSTARSGRTPTGRSQPGASSTTSTATASTIASRTSSASPAQSTPPTTDHSGHGQSGCSVSDNSSDESANSRPNSLPAGRDGQPSAERRYGSDGGFRATPGGRRPVDGAGYSRFFLIPKASRSDREPDVPGLPTMLDGGVWGGDEDDLTEGKKRTIARQNTHPTVKPTRLMRHLIRLVTPEGGTVLDPFLGSGTTAKAAVLEGIEWVGIEREPDYVRIAEQRLVGLEPEPMQLEMTG